MPNPNRPNRIKQITVRRLTTPPLRQRTAHTYHAHASVSQNLPHSVHTQVRRASYYWLLDALDTYLPHVWEYARLNITNTVLSKRKLNKLVTDQHVHGCEHPSRIVHKSRIVHHASPRMQHTSSHPMHHPACIMHPSCITHRASCIVSPHASPRMHHASCITHRASCIVSPHASPLMHHASCIMHHLSCIMHRLTPCIVHPSSCIMHPACRWDDPRLLTLSGLRRRGAPAAAINKFCGNVGITRNENLIHMHQVTTPSMYRRLCCVAHGCTRAHVLLLTIRSEGSSLSPGKGLHDQRSSRHAKVPLSDTQPHPEGGKASARR